LDRYLPGFGESLLNFTLVCQVAEFTDQYPVRHELHKRIFKRFREEGIEIPFPIRTVYLRDDSSIQARPAGLQSIEKFKDNDTRGPK
jgi:small-conductance mechanosensitive channel